MQIEQTEIDGVRVLWADVGPGQTVGALSFGVGRVDETAATAGISHLVEHLALAGFGQQDFDHNAFVDVTRTVVHAAGTAGEVASHLGAVTRGLTNIPWSRLPIERRILRDEAEQAGPSIAGALLWYRFGAQAFGLPGLDEHGLGWLGPDRVKPWVSERYTRDNAIVWLSGPPSADLRFELPSGMAHPRPAVTGLAGMTYPTHVPWEGPGVALSYLTSRSPEAIVAAGVLDRRARQQLRFDQGLVYDIILDYVQLDATTAHVIVGADCPDERIPAVRDALLDVIDRLAAEGPTEAELASERSMLARGFEDREGRIGYLDSQAADVLMGLELRQPAEAIESRASIGIADIRDAFGAGIQTLLMLAAGETFARQGWHTYPAWSSSAVRGREFRPSGFHLPGRAPKERLVIGADGLMVRLPDGALTVKWPDVAACLHEEGARMVIGTDGIQVPVVAEHWRDGADAMAAIDSAVPRVLVACDEHGIGALEDPEETLASQPAATASTPAP